MCVSTGGGTVTRNIAKLARDLSSAELYDRKHAAWTLARIAQKGGGAEVVSAGAVPKLAECLRDPELIVRYRALWALLELAKRGQGKAILGANIISDIETMVGDETVVETCHRSTDELVRTTVGGLAAEAMRFLQG
jgi:hypothetical protein